MMKILLDTHILLWFCNGDERLPVETRELIADEKNEIYYSILSVFEVEIKHAAHPDRISMSGEQLLKHCQMLEFVKLPLEIPHILAMKKLVRKENTPPHRDPFDRLMISQAIVESMIFITHDARIAEYICPLIYKI